MYFRRKKTIENQTRKSGEQRRSENEQLELPKIASERSECKVHRKNLLLIIFIRSLFLAHWIATARTNEFLLRTTLCRRGERDEWFPGSNGASLATYTVHTICHLIVTADDMTDNDLCDCYGIQCILYGPECSNWAMSREKRDKCAKKTVLLHLVKQKSIKIARSGKFIWQSKEMHAQEEESKCKQRVTRRQVRFHSPWRCTKICRIARHRELIVFADTHDASERHCNKMSTALVELALHEKMHVKRETIADL